MARTIYTLDGRSFVFKSDHPLEERVVELTEDYRDAAGNFIIPEAVAWDGVETSPGVVFAAPREDA